MKKSLKKISFIAFLIIFVSGCTLFTEESEESNTTDTEEPESTVEDEMAEDNTEDVGIVTEVGYIDITPAGAKSLIDTNDDIIIIDVSPKYDEGHIPGAINYYVGDGSLDAVIDNLDKSKTYLVYCHVDSASILGATKLIEAEFDNVYRLIGNYSAWVDAGYDIEN